MWTTVYVVDKNGYIRWLWQGELNWQAATGDKSIEKLVDELLDETPSELFGFSAKYSRTPKLNTRS